MCELFAPDITWPHHVTKGAKTLIIALIYKD
jgi:hypothetical protein